MNLRDLTPKTSSATMGKLLESYFQKKTRFSALSESAAKQMLAKVNATLVEYKSSTKRHTSEKDETYLGLMFMKEGLTKRIAELATPTPAKPINAQTIANPNTPAMKKTADALKSAQAGKTLNGQAGAEVAGLAAMKTASNPNALGSKNPAVKKAIEKGVKNQPLNQQETGLLAQAVGEGIEDRLEAAREKAAAKGKTVKSGEEHASTDSKKRFVRGKQYGAQDDKEELDEVSKDTLNSYLRKAAKNPTERLPGIKAAGKQLAKKAGKEKFTRSSTSKAWTPKDAVEEDAFDDAMADFKAKGGKVQKVAPGSAKNPISTASRHIGGKGEVTKRGAAKRVGHKANTTPTKPVAGETSANSNSGKYGYGKGVYEGATVQESFNQLYHRFLAEGADVDQAQVVLAAQDMVDSVQDMLEKVGKMKIDELYPLTDSIKSSLGTDKAASFSQAVDASLQTILDVLQGARTELSNAVAALTGEEVDPGFAANLGDEGDAADDLGLGDEGDMGGDEMGGDDAADLGLTPDAAEAEPLGRERRA